MIPPRGSAGLKKNHSPKLSPLSSPHKEVGKSMGLGHNSFRNGLAPIPCQIPLNHGWHLLPKRSDLKFNLTRYGIRSYSLFRFNSYPSSEYIPSPTYFQSSQINESIRAFRDTKTLIPTFWCAGAKERSENPV